MGDPAPLTRRRSRSVRCVLPSMRFPVAVQCGGCGVPSGTGRELLRHDCVRGAESTGLVLTFQPHDPHAGVNGTPALAMPRATTARLRARLLPMTSAKLRKAPRRPSAVWRCAPIARNRRHGARCLGAVHLPARRDTVRSVALGPRLFRDLGPGFPGGRRIAPTRPACPDYRVSPAHAVSLRQRRIASTRPDGPGLPGGPGNAVVGRRQHGGHCTPVISASPAPRS